MMCVTNPQQKSSRDDRKERTSGDCKPPVLLHDLPWPPPGMCRQAIVALAIGCLLKLPEAPHSAPLLLAALPLRMRWLCVITTIQVAGQVTGDI